MHWTASRLKPIFTSVSYETADDLADALNDIEDCLYELADSTIRHHLRHFLRHMMTITSDGTYYHKLLHEEIRSSLDYRGIAYDTAIVEGGLVAHEDQSVVDEQAEQQQFYKVLNELNDTVAEHTDGQGPNCVYGVGVFDYVNERFGLDEDEVLLLAVGAVEMIATCESERHIPIVRPGGCTP